MCPRPAVVRSQVALAFCALFSGIALVSHITIGVPGALKPWAARELGEAPSGREPA